MAGDGGRERRPKERRGMIEEMDEFTGRKSAGAWHPAGAGAGAEESCYEIERRRREMQGTDGE